MSKSLEDFRKRIDLIDSEFLKLLKERFQLMPEITEFKRKNNIPVFQPERESQILEAKKKQALDLGLNPEFVEKIFNQIIDESKRIQELEK